MSVYKRGNRDTRRIIEEGNFRKGMFYTSNLVDASTTRLLLNYLIRDNGGHLVPRLGLDVGRNISVNKEEIPFRAENPVPGVHARFFGMYKDSDGLDKFGHITLSFGVPNHPEYRYYMTDTDRLDDSYHHMVYTNSSGLAFGTLEDSDKNIHLIDMSALTDTRLRFYKDTPKPLFTVFNNKLYTIDGSPGTKIGEENYTSKGKFLREAKFPFNGSFIDMNTRPINTDVAPFTIETKNPASVVNGSVSIDRPMRYLKVNGIYDSYNLATGEFTQRVDVMDFEDLMALPSTIAQHTNTSILSIPKPIGFAGYGSTAGNIFKTSEFGGFTELDMTDKNVLDQEANLWKYSVRTSTNTIDLVVPKGMSLEGAVDSLYGANFRFSIKTPVKTVLDSFIPLNVVESGTIQFNVPAGLFPLDVEYEISYKQPIYSYEGGLLEYSFFKTDEGFTCKPTTVVAKVPTISEATSVGFNMLHPNPYGFQNKEGNVLRAMGIMPYVPNSAQAISMSANIGEEVTFECIYEYKKDQKYFVKWEYMPLSHVQSLEPQVLQDFAPTATIMNGANVQITVKANDEKFTLRCTLVPEITSGDKKGERDDVLAKVVVYPVYEAGNTYLKDISAYKYNLHNATGIGSYKTMLCLWGVPGAETTLFLSDVDDVSYFPFANNILSFNNKILGTQNYQGGLLVFTTDSIYLVTGHISSKFEVVELYQNLKFTAEDVESLKVVKNVIFIRSGSNYYSLSPNSYTGDISDIRLTNLSAPIKEIVSEWRDFIRFLADEVFNWDLTWDFATKIKEYDFFNYVEDSVVHNVYRFAVYEYKGLELHRYQIDISLNFNTTSGTWYVTTLNLPFNEVVHADSKFHTGYSRGDNRATEYFYQTIDYKDYTRKDEYNTIFYGHAFNDIQITGRETELQQLPPTYTDEIVSVIDGDTLMLKELGSLRLLYVNAPESTTKIEEFGPEATELMRAFMPEGSTVTLEFEGDRSDKYGRVLAWVRNHEGLLAQLYLAEQGGVSSVYAYGQDRYAAEIDTAIQTAYDNHVGLYAVSRRPVKYLYSYKSEDILPNYQAIDTGNKDHDSYQVKRYREFQMQMTNRSGNNLNMFSRFYIEGKRQQDFRKYEMFHDTDPNSKNYGTISVEPVDTFIEVAAAETSLNTWQLGYNVFPELDVMNVRLHISGKGRYPRMLLISKNESDYDLLSYAWVLRGMNYR